MKEHPFDFDAAFDAMIEHLERAHDRWVEAGRPGDFDDVTEAYMVACRDMLENGDAFRDCHGLPKRDRIYDTRAELVAFPGGRK
jgi:hypothetical protein